MEKGYLCNLKLENMKRILLYILFWGGFVGGWYAMGECVLALEQQTEYSEAEEMKRYVDPMIYVLSEANHFADVLIRPTNPSSTHWVHRPRLGGGLGEGNLESCVAQKSIFNHLFKSFHELSQGCAALLKGEGYYLYALRKIVV